MRLLRLRGDTAVELSPDLVHDIPPYAILSHRWGAEQDEPTFQDITTEDGKCKVGFKKILYCGHQAKQDGLEYFWVDTCCINKNSHSELSEAITSMFRWYQRAMKCYAYLADVHRDPRDGQQDLLDDSFVESQWFTRGWTLQELLAPAEVIFYSSEWSPLGDKRQLRHLIHEATGISTAALAGASLREFSEHEILRWASRRDTKREEDQAYCLLGLLDVTMSIRYGSKTKELDRLLSKISNRASARLQLDGQSMKEVNLDEQDVQKSLIPTKTNFDILQSVSEAVKLLEMLRTTSIEDCAKLAANITLAPPAGSSHSTHLRYVRISDLES